MFFFVLFIFFSLFHYSVIWTEQYVVPISASEFKLIKIFSTKHSFIGIVKRKNTLYIVKQKKNRTNIYWSIMQSVIADRIASSTEKIFSQHVYIIPKEMLFPGKVFQDEAASLHTVVPGISVQRWQMNMGKLEKEEMRELIRKFSIKQNPKINISIIRCMAKHNDLPFILALHTLLGFYDGHKRNVFYDIKTDRFSVIDMDCSYKINLSLRAYRCIVKLLRDQNITQKAKIKNVLLDFACPLECIMEKNPIENFADMIADIASSITNKEKKIIRAQCRRRTSQIELFLKESYDAAHDIITLIRQEYLL